MTGHASAVQPPAQPHQLQSAQAAERMLTCFVTHVVDADTPAVMSFLGVCCGWAVRLPTPPACHCWGVLLLVCLLQYIVSMGHLGSVLLGTASAICVVFTMLLQ